MDLFTCTPTGWCHPCAIITVGRERFTDETERAGVSFTGWSWNARFVDVDNDEWQDIHIVAGSWFRATRSATTANFFFHNEAGKQFSDKTDAFGLQNFMIVSAYTILDFDRDGDLDFITNSVNGPLWLLRNNARSGNRLLFSCAMTLASGTALAPNSSFTTELTVNATSYVS